MGWVAAVAALAGFYAAEVKAQAIAAGVEVDAGGVLKMKVVRDASGQLSKQRIADAKAKLDPKLAAVSKIRKLSLNRLEAALDKALQQGGIPDEMKYLAGLTRIEYVFFYPETNDIVIAGPAEGYMLDPVGRVVGVTSGQSILELQDLVVALRAFPPSGQKTPHIGVSIDPTQEGLKRLQETLVRMGGRLQPGNFPQMLAAMREALGLQNVTIRGVSPKSHFAQVLVEADYRMKLIGIGLEPPPVKMTVFVDKARPASVSRNALLRWYFVPNYDAVRMSEDEMAMQLVGDGVKLVGADEVVRADGTRVETGGGKDIANELWTKSFTEKYGEISRKAPVYAQLRNLIDMSIAAAFIQDRDWYTKAHWKMPLLMDEAKIAVETYNVPKQVETAINAISKGNQVMTPIGGGVSIDPLKALENSNRGGDEGGKIKATRSEVKLNKLGAGQWWWD